MARAPVRVRKIRSVRVVITSRDVFPKYSPPYANTESTCSAVKGCGGAVPRQRDKGDL